MHVLQNTLNAFLDIHNQFRELPKWSVKCSDNIQSLDAGKMPGSSSLPDEMSQGDPKALCVLDIVNKILISFRQPVRIDSCSPAAYDETTRVSVPISYVMLILRSNILKGYRKSAAIPFCLRIW